jgi:TRAP-type mannitol/chloroaromatic compound transport system permease large subunit
MLEALPSGGLWMLVVLGVLTITTGLPVWALLIATASAFAGGGWLFGLIDARVLSAISGRTLGLLENDLLQALPLYVFVGVLLQRLSLADTLFSAAARLFRWTGAGTSMAAFGIGAVVAPMNGSVASSSAMLARLVSPRLGKMDGAAGTALISVSSTIGVVVPPSLVLILLGDAMLRAHTEASNLSGPLLAGQRIVNTQDIFHAALLPALTVLVLWMLVAWWQGRKVPADLTDHPLTRGQWLLSASALMVLILLLTSVFLGKVYAVEAAATGGVLLLVVAVLSRTLDRLAWCTVLSDTLNLSGSLIALLVGATTFSLIFRLFGTDRWVTSLVLDSHLAPVTTAALVLLAIAMCAWVLDAFEMIFVIIPFMAPPLITLLADAQQVAVLLLLVLQLSFLIPPMGYAVMMTKSNSGLNNTPVWNTLKALLPYIVVQCFVTTMVFLVPSILHQLDAPVSVVQPHLSAEDLDQQIRDMAEKGGLVGETAR